MKRESRGHHSSWQAVGLGLLAGLLLAASATSWYPRAQRAGGPDDPANAQRPRVDSEGGYVSSRACRSCHPREYESWYETHHRTMTQVVSPETMIPDWSGTVTIRNRDYHLIRRGDQFYVDMLDPQYGSNERTPFRVLRGDNETQRVEVRVLMATGSHHQQVYWIAAGEDRRLHLLPFTWMVEDERWIPYEHSFLGPDAEDEYSVIWNEQCIKCHTTAGRPRVDLTTGHTDTHVGELGISCEACHGPGQDHVAANQGILGGLRRYALHLTGRGDDTIVHPEKLSTDRSNDVCGQCHSVTSFSSQKRAQEWWQSGFTYRPGDDLKATRRVLERPHGRSVRDWMSPFDYSSGWSYFESHTWSDGQVRTSGRDYNGILKSECARGGQLTCLSCHSMHDSEPEDQLARGFEGDEACLQCHETYREDLRAHTRHDPESSGSRCANCHMPHTTYGLFKAIRSHTLGASPSVEESLESNRPNACNLCHLDRSLGWTAQHLEAWTGRPVAALPSEEEATRSAAALWLLRGNAVQRALVAWHMGWGPALDASGKQWMAPFLAEALVDPYAAVRYIAARSLGKLDGFEELSYDYVDTPEKRNEAREWTHRTWSERRSLDPLPASSALFVSADGGLDREAVDEVIQRRDDRQIRIAE
ncbi:hypothetical protein MK489_20020 [Myxococcota bacterium]|nr:hypothetical protein [Myxococcota bacterium]